jgi:2-polyprenyl-6-methoxyphenol hydroxylase-like FAD-dependent oxidoreductase
MNVAIIGGGITGLTTAIALKKLNINFKVFEKSPVLNEVGAGIWLQSNSLKVFDWLGVGEKVRNAGIFLDRAEITNPDLKPLRIFRQNVLAQANENSIISIHRARLQKILYEALPDKTIEMGKEYKSHEVKNGKVLIKFNEGSFESDLLVGADGINSKVRKLMFPFSATRYSGQTSWRGVARMKLKGSNNTARESWGKGIRFGFTPVSEEEVYWFAVAIRPEKQKDNPNELKNELIKMYDSFDPVVIELIHNTPHNKIIRTDISDLHRLDSWHLSKACLIGDAAHATTPNLGQGAGQGIEDAFYISKILSENPDTAKAFILFEKERRNKVDYIVNTSWNLGKMAHHPFGQRILKLTLKLMPEKLAVHQTKKITHVKI